VHEGRPGAPQLSRTAQLRTFAPSPWSAPPLRLWAPSRGALARVSHTAPDRAGNRHLITKRGRTPTFHMGLLPAAPTGRVPCSAGSRGGHQSRSASPCPDRPDAQRCRATGRRLGSERRPGTAGAKVVPKITPRRRRGPSRLRPTTDRTPDDAARRRPDPGAARAPRTSPEN
jgi:hypothetical protein